MSKKVKVILISAASLFALIIIALVGISVYISSNADSYKHYLTDAVEEKAGIKLRLNGPVSVSVFPWVGMEAEDVVIENPERFKSFGENLLTAEKIGVELGVVSLLMGDIEVGDVRVEGLKLGLVVDKEGVGNWVFGAKDEKNAATSEAAPAPAQPETGAEASGTVVEEPADSGALSIGSVIMEKSNISYLDAASGQEYRVENIDLKTGSLGIGEDVSIQFAGDFFASEPAFEGSLNLNAEFNFKDARNIEVSNLNGKLASKKGFLGESEASIDLVSTLEGSNLDVEQFAFELAGTKVTLSGKGNLDNYTFSGPLNIQSSPKRLLEVAGVDLELPGTALEDFSLSAQFSSSKSSETKISNISAKLDNTNLTGDLLVDTGKGPKFSGKLAIGSINLDEYLPGGSSGGGSSGGYDGGKAASGNGNSGESSGASKYTPPTLGLDVDLTIGALSVKDMRFQNIKTKVTGKDSVYSLDPLVFDFASSRWNAGASANLAQATPSYRGNLDGKGVNIEELLKALTGKAQVSGKADVNANITASGSGDGVLKSLGGTGGISAQGNINSLKLPQVNLTAAPGVSPVDTVTARLNLFSATFKGSNGVFTNNDMVFDTSAGKGRGNGTINVGASSLSYLVTVETSTINLPIRISGPFSSLSYSLDAEAMLADPANLRRGAETLIDKHGDKIEKGIEKGLGKLFGN